MAKFSLDMHISENKNHIAKETFPSNDKKQSLCISISIFKKTITISLIVETSLLL